MVKFKGSSIKYKIIRCVAGEVHLHVQNAHDKNGAKYYKMKLLGQFCHNVIEVCIFFTILRLIVDLTRLHYQNSLFVIYCFSCLYTRHQSINFKNIKWMNTL